MSMARHHRSSRGLFDQRSLALERSALAKDAVSTLPPSRARDALMTVADATVHRPA